MYDFLIVFCAKYLIALPFFVLGFYFLFAPRKLRNKMLLLSAVSLPLAYVVGKITGLFYSNPRPFVTGHFTPLVAHAADNGFPSDHMLFASTVAMIVLYFNKRVGVALWVVAIVIGFARVAAGVHHAIDIFAAAVIAVAAVVVAQIVLRPRNSSIAPPVDR